jgi:Phage integrase, N-terminal SAM-like domain
VTDGPGGEPRFHYLVRWRDDQRIEHARIFPTEGEAAEFDSDIKAGRTEPRSRPRRQPSATFQVEAMDWPASKQATKRAVTAARYESHLGLHGLPAFGSMPVAAITRHHVQRWINILTRDNLSASTIGDIYRGVFKAVLNKAILDGRLAVSPCRRIELPQLVAEEVVPPTPERDQPVPALIAAAVEAHLRVCAPAPCGLLFTTAAGAALNIANFRNRVWKPAVRAADGVPDQMRFHDLRHACLPVPAASRSGLALRGCGLSGPACGPETVSRPDAGET